MVVVVVVVEDEIGMEVGEWMVVSCPAGPHLPKNKVVAVVGGRREGGRDPRKGRKGYVFCVRIEKRKIGNREIIINGG